LIYVLETLLLLPSKTGKGHFPLSLAGVFPHNIDRLIFHQSFAISVKSVLLIQFLVHGITPLKTKGFIVPSNIITFIKCHFAKLAGKYFLFRKQRLFTTLLDAKSLIFSCQSKGNFVEMKKAAVPLLGIAAAFGGGMYLQEKVRWCFMGTSPFLLDKDNLPFDSNKILTLL